MHARTSYQGFVPDEDGYADAAIDAMQEDAYSGTGPGIQLGRSRSITARAWPNDADLDADEEGDVSPDAQQSPLGDNNSVYSFVSPSQASHGYDHGGPHGPGRSHRGSASSAPPAPYAATDYRPRYEGFGGDLWLKPSEFMSFMTVNDETIGFLTAHRQIVINVPLWKLAPGARVLGDLRTHKTTLGEEVEGSTARASIDALGRILAMIGLHSDGTAPNGSHIESATSPTAPQGNADDNGDAPPGAHEPDSRGRSRGREARGRSRGKGDGEKKTFPLYFEVDEGDGVKRAVAMKVNMIEYLQAASAAEALDDGSDRTVALRLWIFVLDPKFSDLAGLCRRMEASAVSKGARQSPRVATATADHAAAIEANLVQYRDAVHNPGQWAYTVNTYGMNQYISDHEKSELMFSMAHRGAAHPMAPEQVLDPACAGQEVLLAGLDDEKGRKLAIWSVQTTLDNYFPNRDKHAPAGRLHNTLLADSGIDGEPPIDLRMRTDVVHFPAGVWSNNLLLMLDPYVSWDVLRTEMPPLPSAATRVPISAVSIYKRVNDRLDPSGLGQLSEKSAIAARCFTSYTLQQPCSAEACKGSASVSRAMNREMGIADDESVRASYEQPHKALERELGRYRALLTTYRADRLVALKKHLEVDVRKANGDGDARARAEAAYQGKVSELTKEYSKAMADYITFGLARSRELLLTHADSLPAGWVHACDQAASFLSRPEAAKITVSKVGYTAASNLSPFGHMVQRRATYARQVLRFANELTIYHHQSISALEAQIARPKWVVMYFGGYSSGKSHNITLLAKALLPNMTKSCGSSSLLANKNGINPDDGFVCTWDEMPQHAKEGSQDQEQWKELVTNQQVSHKRTEEYLDARGQKRWRPSIMTTYHNEKMLIVSNSAWLCGATSGSAISGGHKAWMSRNVFVFCRRPPVFPEESSEALLASPHGLHQHLAQLKMHSLFSLVAFCCNCIPGFGPDLSYARKQWDRLDAALHEEQDVPALVEMREKQNREMLFTVTAIQHAIHVRFFDAYAIQFAGAGVDLDAPFGDDFQKLASLAPLLAAPTPEVVSWVWQLHAYTRSCVAPVFDAIAWSLLDHFDLNATNATDELPSDNDKVARGHQRTPSTRLTPGANLPAPSAEQVRQSNFHPLPFYDTQILTNAGQSLEEKEALLETKVRRKLEIELKISRGGTATSAEKQVMLPSVGDLLMFFSAEEIKTLTMSATALDNDAEARIGGRATSRFEMGGVGRNGVITRFPTTPGGEGQYRSSFDFSVLQSTVGQSYAAAGEALARAPYLSGLGVPPHVVSEGLRVLNHAHRVTFLKNVLDDNSVARRAPIAATAGAPPGFAAAGTGAAAIGAAIGGVQQARAGATTIGTGSSASMPRADQFRVGTLRTTLIGDGKASWIERAIDHAARNGGFPAVYSVVSQGTTTVTAPPLRIACDSSSPRSFGRAQGAQGSDKPQERFVLEVSTAFLMRQSQRAAIAALYNKGMPGIGSIREIDMPSTRAQADGSQYDYTTPAFWGDVFYASVSSAIRTVVHHVNDGPEFVSAIGAPSSHIMLTIPMNRTAPKLDPRHTNSRIQRLDADMAAENRRHEMENPPTAADRDRSARNAKNKDALRRRTEAAKRVNKMGPAAMAIACGRSVGPTELAAINATSAENNAYQDDGGASDPWPRYLYGILSERGLLGSTLRGSQGSTVLETYNSMLDLRACRTRNQLSRPRIGAGVGLHAEASEQSDAAEAAEAAAPLVAGHEDRDVEEAIAQGGAPQDHFLQIYETHNHIQADEEEGDDDDDDDDENENDNDNDDGFGYQEDEDPCDY